MADEYDAYLDLTGLGYYNEKIKTELEKKVDAEAGKGLSTNDFTTAEKEKLEGLENYILPAASAETLGGVKIAQTEDPVPEKTALKTNADGQAFVDWSQAPLASTTDAGLVKLGSDFTVDPETGTASVSTDIKEKQVSWSDISDKPDVALKTDIGNVYTYKGSVASQSALPTENVETGSVYNVEDTGMNYAWTGEAWDALGSTIAVQRITNEQIDALFA